MSESGTLSGDLTPLIVETDETTITTTDTLDSPVNCNKFEVENGGNDIPRVQEPKTATTPNRVFPSLKPPLQTSPHTPISPDGRRYRQLYEDLKKKYLIQKQSMTMLEKERKELDGKLSKVVADGDAWREKYEALREENMKEKHANQICAGLHRIQSEDSIIRLKQTAKQKKKQTTTDELSCAFEDCSAKDVDLIKCNMCSTWVCGDCNEVPVAKLKPIFNKCRRLYFLCKTCDEKIGSQEGFKVSDDDTARSSGNDDFMNSLQRMLDKKVTQLEAKIDKSLDKKLGDKFGEVKSLADKIKEQEKKSTEEKKTYAKILEVPKEVRQIIQETRNDDKVNQVEQEKRSQNFIIHGAEEIGANEDEIKENDERYVIEILEHLEIVAKPEGVIRLGKVNENKARVMKITMPTKVSKDKVMDSLRKLKGTEETFGKLSVTDDYTVTERKQIQEFVKKAREQGKQDTSQVFKVRGDPKNGLRIISYKKK